MSNNINHQQSAINYQQQHDLMQVAALMFPSLFMAHQTTSASIQPQTSNNIQQANYMQLQQQQQQQHTDQTNKLLATLIQQQTGLNQQAANNNWLSLLSEPTDNQNNTQKPENNGLKTKTLNNRINGNLNRPSKINIDSNKMLNRNNSLVKSEADTEARQTNKPKKHSNSSVFSIKDLIGNSEHHERTALKKQSGNKSIPIKYSDNFHSTQQHQQNLDQIHSNQNDRLLMFAAAAAVLQNSDTNGKINDGSSGSYNWLVASQMNQQNDAHVGKKQTTSHSQSKMNYISQNQKTKSHSNSTINAIYEANNNNNNNFNNKNNNTTNANNNGYNNNHCQYENVDRELEAKLKLPLMMGWRRETIVKEIYKNGVKGDVIYYSPCSKKLRTFQEIERVRVLLKLV